MSHKRVSKKPEFRTCVNCNKVFKAKSHNQKYCCKECQIQHYKDMNYNSIKAKKHYADNKERYKQKHHEYYITHKKETAERVKRNRETRGEEYKEHRRNYLKERRKTDIEFKLKEIIKARINWHVKKDGQRTVDFVNYTMSELRSHLEKQFKPDMTWENYGKVWCIDHIRPVASYKFLKEDGTKDLEAIADCWSLDNLQPLYCLENSKKNSFYNGVIYVKGKPITDQ